MSGHGNRGEMVRKKKQEKKIEKEESLIEEKAKKLEEEINSLRKELHYLYADFDNYKKHAEKEKELIRKAAGERIIKELLNVIDDFERMLKNFENEKKEIYEGVKMVYDKFIKVLEKEGLRKIEAAGKKFDPYYHEAVEICSYDDKEDNIVLEELQHGYMLNSIVLRTAKVKVNRR